jgi:L-alanine-DL-glutamate epimerase-like enolase superfamily enzyme
VFDVDLTVGLLRRSLDHSIPASTHVHEERTHIVVWIEDQGIVGCGSVSTASVDINGDPATSEVLTAIHDTLIPRLSARWRDALQHPYQIAALAPDGPAGRAAACVLDLAVLDYQLQNADGYHRHYPPTTAVGVIGTGSLIGPQDAMPNGDVVRVKTSAGAAPERFEILEDLDAPVLLDFNGGGGDVTEVVRQAMLVHRHGTLLAVEQPFRVGDFVTTAALRREGIPVSLDESIRTVRDLLHATRYEAADLVCLKLPRIGGVASLLTMVDHLRKTGTPWYLGGFFDLPRTRAVMAVLAAHLGAGASDISGAEWERYSPEQVTLVGQWSFDSP